MIRKLRRRLGLFWSFEEGGGVKLINEFLRLHDWNIFIIYDFTETNFYMNLLFIKAFPDPDFR